MPAFLIYLAGTASMLMSDVLATKFMDNSEIALLADVRALFGILGALITLGLEMVIIRIPSASRLLLRLVFIQAVALSVPVGFFVHLLGYLSSPWSGILLTAGSACLVAQGQFFRSHGAFVSSQLVQQTWKIIILILITCIVFFRVETAWPIDFVVAAVVFLISILGWSFILTGPGDLDHADRGFRNHYTISFRFLATNIILNLALFGEQLTINGLGTNLQSSIYFTHMTYFLLPVTVISAFVGFRIGPWLRDNPVAFELMLARHRIKLFFGVIFAVTLAQTIGWLGWQFIRPSVGDVNVFLMIGCFISACLRIYYVLPSAYTGLFGSTRDHDVLIVTQIILLFIIAATIYVTFPFLDIIIVVTILGVINWLVRTLISDSIMKRIILRRQTQT